MDILLPGASTIFRAIRCVLAMGPPVLALISGTPTALAQMPTPAMVEAHIMARYAAWASLNLEEIVKLEPPANGFGFRTAAARSADAPLPEYRKIVKSFLDLMDYYRIELNELHTAVEGDVVLAWGFQTQDYRLKGRAPQKVRVRFTMTLKYERNRWRTLLYHRDIQRFDENGRAVITQ